TESRFSYDLKVGFALLRPKMGDLSPVTRVPAPAMVSVDPGTSHPNGMGPWWIGPAAWNPDPTAVPTPVAIDPDIIRRRCDRNNLHANRRRLLDDNGLLLW